MKKKNKLVEASFIIGLIVAMFFVVTNLPMIPVMEEGHIKSWHGLTLPALGDIAPAAGQSGVVNVSIVKHGLYTYTNNFTRNESMFGYTETNNTEAGADVPYGIQLDLVVKVRWNRTHAYNTTSKQWNLDWVRGNVSMPQFGLQNHTMDEYNISSVGWEATQDFLWVQYVYDGGGSSPGFSINKSQRIYQCYFRFWAYY